MCSVLQISRSTYYYESKEKADETKLTAEIKRIFREGRNIITEFTLPLVIRLQQSIEKITLKKLSNKVLTIHFEYIESWYNRKRIHSALGYLTPQERENMERLVV